MFTAIGLLLVTLFGNIQEGKLVFFQVVWNNVDTPRIVMSLRSVKGISIFDASHDINVLKPLLCSYGIFHAKHDGGLSYGLSWGHQHREPPVQGFDDDWTSFSVRSFRLIGKNLPNHEKVRSVRTSHIAEHGIKVPANFIYTSHYRFGDNSFPPDICTHLYLRNFLLFLHRLKLFLEGEKLTACQISQILDGIGLHSCRSNELVSLRRGRLHFVQLALNNNNADNRCDGNYNCANSNYPISDLNPSNKAIQLVVEFIASAIFFMASILMSAFAVTSSHDLRFGFGINARSLSRVWRVGLAAAFLCAGIFFAWHGATLWLDHAEHQRQHTINGQDSQVFDT